MKHLCTALLVLLALSTLPAFAQDEDCMKRAYDFLVQGHRINEELGFSGIRKLGKVLKEEQRQLQGGEIRTLLFQGMSISAFLIGSANDSKMFLTDVNFSAPNWVTKFNIGVGTSREVVERTLCIASTFGQPDNGGLWSYADGLAEVVITFDSQRKVSSIKWHYDLD